MIETLRVLGSKTLMYLGCLVLGIVVNCVNPTRRTIAGVCISFRDEIKEGRSRGRRHNYIDPLVNLSGEDVTVGEFFGHIVVTNEPLIILLKNTISDAIAELIDDSIEA